MPTESFDAIVIGLGGMGSATCARLARRGARVLGLEARTRGHALGSSHGETRLIRQAYFEHPDYVPLLKSAYALWDELGEETGRPVFHRNGLVIYGPDPANSPSPVISGVRQAAALHALAIEEFRPEAARSHWPIFQPPPDFVAIFEAGAGHLDVEASVLGQLTLAERRGAQLRFSESVRDWKFEANHVTVRTNRTEYTAASLVITAGAWSSEILAGEQLRILAHRNLLYWFEADASYRQPETPCFAFDLPYGFFYGFPDLGRGVKIAHHLPGEVLLDPARVDRSSQAADLTPVERFRQASLPGVRANPTEHAVCLYEMSPDGHFVIDRVRQVRSSKSVSDHLAANVVYGAGFSGHGFKFATVIGEVLAELALEGRTSHAVEFLRRNRPTLSPVSR